MYFIIIPKGKIVTVIINAKLTLNSFHIIYTFTNISYSIQINFFSEISKPGWSIKTTQYHPWALKCGQRLKWVKTWRPSLWVQDSTRCTQMTLVQHPLTFKGKLNSITSTLSKQVSSISIPKTFVIDTLLMFGY